MTTVAYQVKTTKTSSSISTSILKSELSTQSTIYEQGYPTHFDNSYEGFKSVYQTLEKIYPEISVDYTKLEAVYKASPAKANDFIAFVNQTLMMRGFWSNLWNGIKHVATTVANGIVSVGKTVVNTVVDAAKTVGGAVATAATAVATGVVEAANAVSGGAIQGAVDTMENATATVANFTANSATALFDDAATIIKLFTGLDIKHFSDSDWGQFGATILMFVLGPEVKIATSAIDEFVVSFGANTIERKVAQWATKHIIKTTIKDYLNWTKNQIQLTIKNSDIDKYQNIPSEIRSHLTIGDNYYNDGTTAYKITIS